MSADTDLVVSELGPIQKRIKGSETDSIKDRWEFGRVLLKHRVGKQLPRGLRAQITESFQIEASEITRRMQFADKFDSLEQVVDVCTRCGRSWRRIVREELPKRPRKPIGTRWEDRAEAKLHQLVAGAGESDERHAALVAWVCCTIR